MPEEMVCPAEAAEWFENERQVLLAVIGKAAESGHAPHAWELPWAAGWYFQDKACWQRLAAAQEAALAVAARLGDLAGLATANQHLGWLRFPAMVGRGNRQHYALRPDTAPLWSA